MSEFDYDHGQPCRTCGEPIYVINPVLPRGYRHGIEPEDGHPARPIPMRIFELTLGRRGKTVLWSGKDAADAVYRYTSYRPRAKVISWREVHYGESHPVGEK